ncbi:protein phosphatase 1 regulatory subunit 1B isoform X3 [Melopsittacus undulatus]|uniref:protein phosphatase 1 regulatory subunit 1B isoform X3 n=1 Tax=Melopsittacus undulatus TaxID=13146 RepID=UPI00146DBDE9|nr:protein phosphatase 1 regulatory subunit 1B isoform X3 [Melopsittacus undulatus]
MHIHRHVHGPLAPGCRGRGPCVSPSGDTPCAPDPAEETHTGHALPALRALIPRGRVPALPAVQRIVQSHMEGGLAGGDSSDGEADDGEHVDPDSALEPAPGSHPRAERSYFSGPKAHKRKGGQKVSFAGGFDERGQDLKSLTVSEIPEDPEGLEEEEEEDGGTGERRHVGFAEVPSRPIGTERHSPTYPLGTS